MRARELGLIGGAGPSALSIPISSISLSPFPAPRRHDVLLEPTMRKRCPLPNSWRLFHFRACDAAGSGGRPGTSSDGLHYTSNPGTKARWATLCQIISLPCVRESHRRSTGCDDIGAKFVPGFVPGPSESRPLQSRVKGERASAWGRGNQPRLSCGAPLRRFQLIILPYSRRKDTCREQGSEE